jgi:DNA replicative helicase MCM subunit Mcm2 (Cdc46/Mcm family)
MALSRFDLLFLLLDRPNERMDRTLAMHIVNLYIDQGQAPVESDIVVCISGRRALYNLLGLLFN